MEMPWWFTFGEVPERDVETIARMIGDGPDRCAELQIVDVRTEMEFRRGHVRGAMNCSLLPDVLHFRARLADLGLDPQRPTLCICLSAHRSISAVKVLRDQGFREPFQMKGGMYAWRAEHLPEVVDGAAGSDTGDGNGHGGEDCSDSSTVSP